jgi:hypothetical protein
VHVTKSVTNSITLFKIKTRKTLILRVLRFKEVVPPGIVRLIKGCWDEEKKRSRCENKKGRMASFQHSSWNAFLNSRGGKRLPEGAVLQVMQVVQSCKSCKSRRNNRNHVLANSTNGLIFPLSASFIAVI